MRLTKEEYQELEFALLSAFPQKDNLKQMVRHQLDQRLETIVGGENQSIVIFNLIEWAETQGKLPELITGAHQENPGNPELQEFYQKWVKSNPQIGIPQNLPRSGIIKLVGREKILETLHQQLQQTERVAITAVAGMGGVGKTELALQYALHHWEERTYPGGICWLQVRDADLGIQILQFAINQLGLKIPEDGDLETKINYCWQKWTEGNVLIILDDVVDYQQIESYLPPSLPKFKFRILITTRIQWLAESFHRLTLDLLEETTALELLVLYVGKERIDREIDEAKQLCAELGFLPLGLELVARYLQRKQDLSLAEMRGRLNLEHRSLQNPSKEMTAKRGVQKAFELSWKELNINDKAQKLACLLSTFALAPIPWDLVEQYFADENVEDLEDIRDDFLVNLSLLERREKGIYQLHQLIRKFLQNQITRVK